MGTSYDRYQGDGYDTGKSYDSGEGGYYRWLLFRGWRLVGVFQSGVLVCGSCRLWRWDRRLWDIFGGGFWRFVGVFVARLLRLFVFERFFERFF